MREILFRGKRTDTGEWVYGNLLIKSNDTETDYLYKIVPISMHEEVSPFVFVIPETVGQYTGLKGSDSKRIYEGDIIRKGLECFVVKWNSNHCRWGLFDKYDFEVSGFNEHTKNYLEIIGNIHDNPELLKYTEGEG